MFRQTGVLKAIVPHVPAPSTCTNPHPSLPPMLGHAVTNENRGPLKIESDRDVVRCVTCGMVQYRTRTGSCRRCLHLVTPKVEFLIPLSDPQELPRDDRRLLEKVPNHKTLENIGQRIRELRESRRITQGQLQARSHVSRSYLSRIESGKMTPSIGTLEKISEALGIGMNRYFIPQSNGEALLEDPFILELRPFLRQLDWEQWQSILKRLVAISDHVSGSDGHVRALEQPLATGVNRLALRTNQPRLVTDNTFSHSAATIGGRT
jgi:transcriptional regulator with XRE-family HTH domain